MITDLVVLPNTPSLLSAGLIERAGYSSSYLPCLVESNTGKVVVFDVCNNIPMILKGGVFETVRDQDTLRSLSGVKIQEDMTIRVDNIRFSKAEGGRIIYHRAQETLEQIEEQKPSSAEVILETAAAGSVESMSYSSQGDSSSSSEEHPPEPSVKRKRQPGEVPEGTKVGCILSPDVTDKRDDIPAMDAQSRRTGHTAP